MVPAYPKPIGIEFSALVFTPYYIPQPFVLYTPISPPEGFWPNPRLGVTFAKARSDDVLYSLDAFVVILLPVNRGSPLALAFLRTSLHI